MSQNIIFQYLEWQFINAPKGILTAWGNCLKFNLNYWSVLLLLRTFFYHWRKYQYSYGKGLDFKRYFEAFTFNMISRILGAIFRSFFIAFGLLTEIFIIFAGLIVILFWLAWPVLFVSGIFYGFKLLF